MQEGLYYTIFRGTYWNIHLLTQASSVEYVKHVSLLCMFAYTASPISLKTYLSSIQKAVQVLPGPSMVIINTRSRLLSRPSQIMIAYLGLAVSCFAWSLFYPDVNARKALINESRIAFWLASSSVLCIGK